MSGMAHTKSFPSDTAQRALESLLQENESTIMHSLMGALVASNTRERYDKKNSVSKRRVSGEASRCEGRRLLDAEER